MSNVFREIFSIKEDNGDLGFYEDGTICVEVSGSYGVDFGVLELTKAQTCALYEAMKAHYEREEDEQD